MIQSNLLLNHPLLKDSTELARLNEMVANGDPRVNAIYMGGGQHMTLDDLNVFIEKAKAEVDPYYNREKAKTERELELGTSGVQDQYNIDVAKLTQDIQDAKRDLDTSEGEKGTWGSSARQERLNSFSNKANLGYQGLFNNAKNKLENTMLQGEYNLGENIQQPTLGQTSASFTQSAPGNINTQQGYKYNPFKQGSGLIAGNRATSIDTRAKEHIQKAFGNQFKYF